MIKFIALLMVLSACNTLPPPPRMDTGLINMKKRVINFKNEQGTHFEIPLNTRNKKDIQYLHNQVCAPGNQVIDFVTWFYKALTVVRENYYNNR